MEDTSGVIVKEFCDWGLFEASSGATVPLEHVDFKVQASYSFCKVVQTLYFRNVNPNNTNALFYFPKSIKSAISKVEVFYGDLRAVCRVMPRMQAKKDFEKAKSEGQTATLVTEQGPNQRQREDAMCIELANLVPGLEISVRFDIVEDITENAGYWQIKIP